MSVIDTDKNFCSFGLCQPLLKSLVELGHKTPSPIQSAAIPVLLNGSDLVGRAPTGTGKTGAFALPIINRIALEQSYPQVLVLTPTRELAIQVAQAFRDYSKYIEGLRVLAIYGGSGYSDQIRGLRRGAHVIVGTPGRVMDHIRRKTLELGRLGYLVLDEADEMLRMGFIEEVESILQHTPDTRQTSLFSATMPKQIKNITAKYLRNPKDLMIGEVKSKDRLINQKYWVVQNINKLDGLTRILEVENFDAILLFVRTKASAAELARQLSDRGYASEALHGDMVQKDREKTVKKIRDKEIDLLVATDVAARGLDVDRITHVVNYDLPFDSESYVHRIGRTGRAGKQGQAILFISPRERRKLPMFERATKNKIKEMGLPSKETVNQKRIANFKEKIAETIEKGELDEMKEVLSSCSRELGVSDKEIAAALGKIFIGKSNFLLQETKNETRPKAGAVGNRSSASVSKRRKAKPPEHEVFRLELGERHKLKREKIESLIAEIAGLELEHLGKMQVKDSHSLIELPFGMPKDVFKDLNRAWIDGHQLKFSRVTPLPKRREKNKANPTNSEKRRKKEKKKGSGAVEKLDLKKKKVQKVKKSSSRSISV